MVLRYCQSLTTCILAYSVSFLAVAVCSLVWNEHVVSSVGVTNMSALLTWIHRI